MLGLGFALVFAILMGTASIFTRRGLATGSFYAMLVCSLAIGSPVFLVLTALTTGFADTPLVGVGYAAAGAVMGSVVARSFYFLGINYLGPGKSLSISATSPLYAALLAWLVLSETITATVLVGTVVIVLGIVVLSRDVQTETEQAEYSLWVVVYPLLGAVFGAISVTLRKIALSAGIAPIEAATVNMVVGFLVVSPLLATSMRRELLDLDRFALRQFLVASTIMAAAFVFYFLGLERTNASVFFPLVQTQPLFAVILTGLFLRELEVTTRWTALGSSLVVAGAALVVIG